MNKLNRAIRKTLLGTAVAFTGIAGASMGFVAPAHAATPFLASPYQDASSGFSSYGAGSRNLDMKIIGATPNDSPQAYKGVWFGAQDLTTGVWYGGWTGTDQSGDALGAVLNIPQTSCGHSFRTDATDWHNGVGTPTDSLEGWQGDSCGPMLGQAITGQVYGNGFTPGAKVVVKADGMTQRVVATIFALHYYPTPPTSSGTISTKLVLAGCGLVTAAYSSSPKVTVATLLKPCIG